MQIEGRIIGQKAIAEYLQCSTATVSRWRTDLGLPVRYEPAGRLYAWTHELDAWISRDSVAIPVDTPRRTIGQGAA